MKKNESLLKNLDENLCSMFFMLDISVKFVSTPRNSISHDDVDDGNGKGPFNKPIC